MGLPKRQTLEQEFIMTFDELVAEVYALTKRPDLISETAAAVKAATLKAHHTDFYSKDLYQTSVSWSSPSFRQQLDYIDLVSNLRSFKFLRKAEDACDGEGDFFCMITPDEILDSYGYNKLDVMYVAGRILDIRSSTEFQYALMACYLHPVVRDGAYCSWVAEQYPYAVIYEACRVIFKTIGYDEQSAQYNNLVADEYTLLRASAIADHAY